VKQCRICGTDLEKDLFAYVAQKPVCCICTVKFVGGDFSEERISLLRGMMQLKDGEYLEQDNGLEASRIVRRVLAR